MVRKLTGILAGIVGAGMLFGSLGTAAAQSALTKDYEGHWAQQTIQSWLDSGLLKGFGDGSVKPNQTITRAEFMTLINRSYHFTEQSKVNFSDVPPTSWAYSEVAKAVAAGYIQGFNNEMRPNAPINRQEAAVIISKLLKLDAGSIEVLGVFSDASQIASWSKGSVAAAVTAKVLKGYPDGTFGPVKPLTRAESLALIDAAVAQTGQSAQGAAAPAPAVIPSATPVATAAPTATAAAAAGGSGGGSGSGGESPATPPPAPTETPGVTATPAATATPLAIPFVDGVKIAVNEDIRTANSVNLTIDFRRVPDELVSKIDHFEQYISNGAVPVEQLLSGEFYPEYFDSLYENFNFPIYAFQLEGITDPYITQVFYDTDNQPVGYFRQKTEMKLMTVTKSDQFSELHDGVTVSRGSVGADVYDIRIDVSEALEQAGKQVVYYSINPQETLMEPSDAHVIDEILTGQNYLYRQDSGTVYFEYSSDKTYYVVFYDSNLQALSYYAGDWKRSEQKALELALTRIQALPDAAVITLADEDAVTAALSKFDILSEDQKMKVSMELQDKLNDSVEAIGNLRPLGSLGYPYFNAVTTGEGDYLNSIPIVIDLQNLPSLLRYTSVNFTLSVTSNPIGLGFLINQGENYKFDLASRPVDIGGPTADSYLNIVLYDKQGRITAYYSEPVSFPAVRAVWSNPIPQITEGVVIRKSDTGGDAEIDISGYVNQVPQSAAYYTLNLQSQERGGLTEFGPETRLLNKEMAYLRSTRQSTINVSNERDDEQYLIIFYDRSYNVLGYYQGQAAYTEQQLLTLASSRLSELPEVDAITLEDEYRVEKARWAFEALTESQRHQLNAAYLAKLEQAESRITELHSGGPISVLPQVGGVVRDFEFPNMVNGTYLGVTFSFLPLAVKEKAVSFKAYLTDQPITENDLSNRWPDNSYPFGAGGYTLTSPELPVEKYVTLVFYDKNNTAVAYNTQKFNLQRIRRFLTPRLLN